MKPFCLQNSLSFFVYLIQLCTSVCTLPWLPAHSSISQHLMNLQWSKNSNADINLEDKLRENNSCIISSKTTQAGKNDQINSNVQKKRLFRWHSITDLPLGNHHQAIVSKSITPNLAVTKMNKEHLQKVTKRSRGIVRSEDLNELLAHFPEIMPRKSTHEMRKIFEKKSLRSKVHLTPLKVEQGPEQAAAVSVRDCMFLPGSSCTSNRRMDLAKLSGYLNNVIALTSATKRSEIDV